MKQTITGTFRLVLRGIPFLFLADCVFTSEKGNEARGLGLTIGPIMIALVGPRFRRKS